MTEHRKLKEEMQKQNKTAFALAKAFGVHSSDLYASIKGTRPLYPKYRRLLSEALNVPEEDLFPEMKEEEGSGDDD